MALSLDAQVAASRLGDRNGEDLNKRRKQGKAPPLDRWEQRGSFVQTADAKKGQATRCCELDRVTGARPADQRTFLFPNKMKPSHPGLLPINNSYNSDGINLRKGSKNYQCLASVRANSTSFSVSSSPIRPSRSGTLSPSIKTRLISREEGALGLSIRTGRRRSHASRILLSLRT